jgi:hypothetical protein
MEWLSRVVVSPSKGCSHIFDYRYDSMDKSYAIVTAEWKEYVREISDSCTIIPRQKQHLAFTEGYQVRHKTHVDLILLHTRLGRATTITRMYHFTSEVHLWCEYRQVLSSVFNVGGLLTIPADCFGHKQPHRSVEWSKRIFELTKYELLKDICSIIAHYFVIDGTSSPCKQMGRD